MINLSNNGNGQEEEGCNHVDLVLDLVRGAIDAIGQDHPNLKYTEIMAALEVAKLEIWDQLKEDED